MEVLTLDKNLYAKLAITNIKKNKEINLPYVIAIIVITIMYYLVIAMLYNDGLKDIPSSAWLKMCFTIANRLITIITFIFVIYINSFLIKKRLKEFGVYNILGLEKKHIIYVMLIENSIIFFGAVLIGLVLGTILGKLSFLILLKICHTTTDSSFIISLKPYWMTMILYGILFFICFILNSIIILRNKTIDLLHREKYGEKKLKGTILFTIIGLLLLGWAYYKANTLDNYMQAIGVFFPAVLAVIVATYFLFMSGSIVLLKILKKNKSFYYKTKNFISTSSLIYRMKQNAVGLANICILSTMAIVTASGCASLYAGQETIMRELHPFDMTIEAQADLFSKEVLSEMAKQYRITLQDYFEFEAIQGAFLKIDNTITKIDRNKEAILSLDNKNIYNLIAMSQDEYNRVCNTSLSLENGQVALASLDDISVYQNGLYAEGKFYEVASIMEESPLLTGKYRNLKQTIYVVFNTSQEAVDFTNLVYENPYDETKLVDLQYINYEGEENDRVLFSSEILNKADSSTLVSNIDTDRVEAYATYGGIIFIGVFFIIIFLTITILIIYFKQVTEGYDDRERFVILQKVGMDASMVKQAINRQIIIVFFMPLIMALVHLSAASNIIKSMMTAFYLVDISLIFKCIGATSAVFAAIYIIVYKLTAKTYFKIVKF